MPHDLRQPKILLSLPKWLHFASKPCEPLAGPLPRRRREGRPQAPHLHDVEQGRWPHLQSQASYRTRRRCPPQQKRRLHRRHRQLLLAKLRWRVPWRQSAGHALRGGKDAATQVELLQRSTTYHFEVFRGPCLLLLVLGRLLRRKYSRLTALSGEYNASASVELHRLPRYVKEVFYQDRDAPTVQVLATSPSSGL